MRCFTIELNSLHTRKEFSRRCDLSQKWERAICAKSTKYLDLLMVKYIFVENMPAGLASPLRVKVRVTRVTTCDIEKRTHNKQRHSKSHRSIVHSLSFSKQIDLLQHDCFDRKHLKSFHRRHRYWIWNAYVAWRWQSKRDQYHNLRYNPVRHPTEPGSEPQIWAFSTSPAGRGDMTDEIVL
jgi:hypothetical protein